MTGYDFASIALVFVACTGAAVGMYYHERYTQHRTQVMRLQSQRRLDREAKAKGCMAPEVEGLWNDLDETQRLRDRVTELEEKYSDFG